MAQDVYFLIFLIRPFIFRKSKQNKYKKNSHCSSKKHERGGLVYQTTAVPRWPASAPLDPSIDRPVEIFFIFFIFFSLWKNI
jgi:hypothetical protein